MSPIEESFFLSEQRCFALWAFSQRQIIEYKVMSNNPYPKTDPGCPMAYQIRIEGHLGLEWTDWFEGLSITLEEDGHTLLTGPVVDQASLYGLLRKVRDLGLPLVSVLRLEPAE
jgi:hypothetical protein